MKSLIHKIYISMQYVFSPSAGKAAKTATARPQKVVVTHTPSATPDSCHIRCARGNGGVRYSPAP